MCHRCDEIDARIARHREQLADVDDPGAIALTELVIKDLEAEKAKLHCDDK